MPEVSRGQHSYGALEISLDGPGITVAIGSYCSIAAHSIYFGAAQHRMSGVSTFPFRERLKWDVPPNAYTARGDLVIGNDVWIGGYVTFTTGVTVGTGAVIGARSVVTKDVPPYAVVCGNPAVVKRYRFAPELIARLLASRWWVLTAEQLAPHAALLTTPTAEGVAAFLDAIGEVPE